MKWNRVSRLTLLLASGLTFTGLLRAQTPAPATAGPVSKPNAVIKVDHGPNSPGQQAKHYVVLVSLDGFRYDYARRYGARNLLAVAARGATAPDGMVPCYPSLTFPSHYSMVTGLYPEHHGIVANKFYDPERKQQYTSSGDTAADGSWYGGTPLWILAEQQDMRAATFFWPASEAEIKGTRPSYYLKFDDKYPDEQRIDQVLAWLRLPSADRPHLITLYYSNVDRAGHDYGPQSPQVAAAVHHVDYLIGRLAAALRATRLPVDLIVVSDHGMEKEQGPWIDLDQIAGVDLSGFDTLDNSDLLYPKSEAAAQQIYDKLKHADARFMVYRRSHVPAGLHFDSNPREGDPVIVATGPYAIRAHPPAAGAADTPIKPGQHGYDPSSMVNMRGIFFAAGPDIRPGSRVHPFENINVFPLVAKILGLDTPPVDASLNVLSGILAASPH